MHKYPYVGPQVGFRDLPVEFPNEVAKPELAGCLYYLKDDITRVVLSIHPQHRGYYWVSSFQGSGQLGEDKYFPAIHVHRELERALPCPIHTP